MGIYLTFGPQDKIKIYKELNSVIITTIPSTSIIRLCIKRKLVRNEKKLEESVLDLKLQVQNP